MVEIIYTKHSLKRCEERWISFEEVETTIHSSKWVKVKYGRFSAVKAFDCNQCFMDIFYNKKEVKVVFCVNGGKIIVITAIARYFME
jgi:hypothetical protein